MAIDDIKDINKLRAMLKESQNEVKYLKECCEQAGLELAKNSYAYDYKEKNLVVQAMAVNEKFFKGKCELTDLKERYEKLKKSNSNYATATIKRNFKLQKIKEKWRELIKMTPLEMAVDSKKILELDNIIEAREKAEQKITEKEG